MTAVMDSCQCREDQKAFAVTSRDEGESRPPEIPTVTFSASRILQPLFQSHRLNMEDLLTALLFLMLIGRHKRRRIYKTGQLGFFFFQMERTSSYVSFSFFTENVVCFLPVRTKPLDIQLRHDRTVFKQSGFCQDHAIFRNDIMAAKHQSVVVTLHSPALA